MLYTLGIIYHGTKKTFNFRSNQELKILEDSGQICTIINRICDNWYFTPLKYINQLYNLHWTNTFIPSSWVFFVLANYATRMHRADWATRPFTKARNCYKIQPWQQWNGSEFDKVKGLLWGRGTLTGLMTTTGLMLMTGTGLIMTMVARSNRIVCR